MMETQAYYDSSSNYQHQHQLQGPLRDTLKRKMTLELNNSDISKFKKSKFTSLQTPIFSSQMSSNEVLASPDVHMCKLGSPDLENLLQGMNSINTPNFCFPKSVLMGEDGGIIEYDMNTSGFDDALISLRKQNQLSNSQNYAPPTTTTASAVTAASIQIQVQPSSYSNSNMSMYAPSESISGDDDSSLLSESSSAYGSIGETSIKQEPRTHSGNSPPISPVDMESQERIKLERKRQRNRLAASKCRKRKLEKISTLEKRVNQLKKENGELAAVQEKLRKTVGELKSQVMKHVQSGCQMEIMMAPAPASAY